MSSGANRGENDGSPGRGAVVLALGNPFRGDDGLGPAVAARLRQSLPAHIPVLTPVDAPAMMEGWDGAALALAVDAALFGAPPGTVRRLPVEGPLPKDVTRCSSHGQGLSEAFDLSLALRRTPRRLVIYAVQAASFQPGTGLSPAVAAVVARLAHDMKRELTAFLQPGKQESRDA